MRPLFAAAASGAVRRVWMARCIAANSGRSGFPPPGSTLESRASDVLARAGVVVSVLAGD